MTEQVIDIILKYIIPLILGYCINVIKNYKKKTNSTNQALKIMLQSNLTNTYFLYSKKKQITDYIYRNWLNMFKEYKNLGGNEFIDKLAEKMEEWEIVHTDILNN